MELNNNEHAEHVFDNETYQMLIAEVTKGLETENKQEALLAIARLIGLETEA